MNIWAEWIAKALKNSGLSQAELSRRLQDRGLRTVDKSAVNKLMKGERRLAADEMLAISAITGYSIPGVLPAQQPALAATSDGARGSEKVESARSHDRPIAENQLRRLMARVFETTRPQGMTPVSADNLAAAILLVCRRPPDLQDDEPNEDQILAQVQALTTLFIPEAPQ
jgi:transcriptional regulator with XRE-family HTH domain